MIQIPAGLLVGIHGHAELACGVPDGQVGHCGERFNRQMNRTSAESLTLGLGPRQTGECPLPKAVPFKLRDRADDGHLQPASCGRQVEAVSEG